MGAQLKSADTSSAGPFRAAPRHFPLKYTKYSCGKIACAARKFLAADRIAGFQMHPVFCRVRRYEQKSSKARVRALRFGRTSPCDKRSRSRGKGRAAAVIPASTYAPFPVSRQHTRPSFTVSRKKSERKTKLQKEIRFKPMPPFFVSVSACFDRYPKKTRIYSYFVSKLIDRYDIMYR